MIWCLRWTSSLHCPLVMFLRCHLRCLLHRLPNKLYSNNLLKVCLNQSSNRGLAYSEKMDNKSCQLRPKELFKESLNRKDMHLVVEDLVVLPNQDWFRLMGKTQKAEATIQVLHRNINMWKRILDMKWTHMLTGTDWQC